VKPGSFFAAGTLSGGFHGELRARAVANWTGRLSARSKQDVCTLLSCGKDEERSPIILAERAPATQRGSDRWPLQ
jgi:hypothetical protein